MQLSRRAARFLVAFAVWNLYVWATFVWNVYPQHHLDSFFLVHLGIGGFTVILGGVVGWIGVRGLAARRRDVRPSPARTEEAPTRAQNASGVAE